MSAVISPCGKYRYRLERPDVFGDFSTAIIMVNPSTADATKNDATIRKLIGFRNLYGWSNLIVGNLFAYRATDVRELATADDPIGPDNDYHLRHIIGEAQRVIVAWGPVTKQPKHLRDRWLCIPALAQPLGKPMLSIGAPAKCGHPCHPLMLAYANKPQPWSPQHETPARAARREDGGGKEKVMTDDWHPRDADLDDFEPEDEDEFDCHMGRGGHCGAAGSEMCEFECPYRREQRESAHSRRKKDAPGPLL